MPWQIAIRSSRAGRFNRGTAGTGSQL